MIQDIMPLRLRNEFENRQPGKDSRMMIFRENEICIKKDGKLDFPLYGDLEDWCQRTGSRLPEAVYLFSVGGESYFLTSLPGKSKKSQEREVPRSAGRYRDHQYCGRCGGRLSHDGKMRMLSCPACGNQVFPTVAPAVIVGVTDGERILMTKYANREYKRYALIAGFTEIGETAEETVQRDGTGAIALDTGELAVAEWVHYKDIPDDPEGLSLTREMMTAFRNRFRE